MFLSQHMVQFCCNPRQTVFLTFPPYNADASRRNFRWENLKHMRITVFPAAVKNQHSVADPPLFCQFYTLISSGKNAKSKIVLHPFHLLYESRNRKKALLCCFGKTSCLCEMGTINLSQLAAREMIKQRFGSALFVS